LLFFGTANEAASIEIKIVDVRCGNDNSKVKICHNGKAICVASESVQDHLDHGDELGSCDVASRVKLQVEVKK